MKSPFRRPQAAPEAAATSAEPSAALTPEAELRASSAAADEAAQALAEAMERRRRALHQLARSGGVRAQICKRLMSTERACAAAWAAGLGAHLALWTVSPPSRSTFSQQANSLVHHHQKGAA